MARTMVQRSTRRGSRMKKRSTTVTRRAGSYGPYRSTKFSRLRTVGRNLRVPRNATPFPQFRVVRHKYCDTITVGAGSAAGLRQVWQFRANSLFDPDFTGVGHQPMFHDEMAAQYGRYTVISSRIEIIIEPSATIARTMSLYTDDDTSFPTNPNDMMEQHKFYSSTRLDKRQTPLILKGWYDAAKWNKTTRAALLADADQKIQTGTNPAAPVAKYFTLLIFPLNPADTLTQFGMTVKISYVAVWREPVDHIGS